VSRGRGAAPVKRLGYHDQRMRSGIPASLVALALACTASGSDGGGASSDAVCRHYAVLAGEAGLLLPKDGSDHVHCVKGQERTRRRLGDPAWAVHAACLLRARHLVEWMACDPREGLAPAPPAPEPPAPR